MKAFGPRVCMNTSSLIGVAAIWLLLGGTEEINAGDNTEFFDTVCVTVPGGAGPVLRNILGIVARHVERRCLARVVSSDLLLTVSVGFAREGITGLPTVGFPEISMTGFLHAASP